MKNLRVVIDHVENKYDVRSVILSEMGYTSAGINGEAKQAKALWLSLDKARDLGVDAIHIRAWMDDPNDGELLLGLLKRDGTQKKAFAVWKNPEEYSY